MRARRGTACAPTRGSGRRRPAPRPQPLSAPSPPSRRQLWRRGHPLQRRPRLAAPRARCGVEPPFPRRRRAAPRRAAPTPTPTPRRAGTRSGFCTCRTFRTHSTITAPSSPTSRAPVRSRPSPPRPCRASQRRRARGRARRAARHGRASRVGWTPAGRQLHLWSPRPPRAAPPRADGRAAPRARPRPLPTHRRACLAQRASTPATSTPRRSSAPGRSLPHVPRGAQPILPPARPARARGTAACMRGRAGADA